VAADGAQHRVGEQPAQERDGEVLVDVVDAAQRGRRAQVVHQVAEVVQQRGGDQRVVGASLLGQEGVCRACCSCVTGSPLYCSPPRLANRKAMSSKLRATAASRS
jgi:Zn-dependent alcohol dehydrogenase